MDTSTCALAPRGHSNSENGSQGFSGQPQMAPLNVPAKLGAGRLADTGDRGRLCEANSTNAVPSERAVVTDLLWVFGDTQGDTARFSVGFPILLATGVLR